MDEKNNNMKLHANANSQGWKPFQSLRDDLLNKFDVARKMISDHPVKVHHGNVAESEFRKWLTEFLPKKYGVTSGHIISQGVSYEVYAPHFDVIIYDRLEAPILYTISSSDESELGKVRAVPVEYVKCIIEVKAAFEVSTVKESVKHVAKINDLIDGEDKSNERYKIFLPKGFIYAFVFFENRVDGNKMKKALEALIEGWNPKAYFGGVILRAKKDGGNPGRLEFKLSNTPLTELSIAGYTHTASQPSEMGNHIISSLMFTEMEFARFAFDLLAALDGKFEAGRLSSFYGIGSESIK